jgi:5-methylcytosine-specific restriction endonuclease McrA
MSTIEQEIEIIKAQIHAYINQKELRADETLRKGQVAPHAKAMERLRNGQRFLHNFTKIVEHMPPYLTFNLVALKKRDPEQVEHIRREFRKVARREFLLSLNAAQERTCLEKMGLNERQIDVICTSGVCHNKALGETFNLTVDHIVDIGHGGKNNVENLRLVQYHMNQVAAYLSHFQVQTLKRTRILELNFVPEQTGGCSKVPVLPWGFEPYEPTRENVWQKVDSHFGGTPLNPVLQY